MEIAKFWKKYHPNYYGIGTRDVLECELDNPGLFFYNSYKVDLVYTGLNSKYVKLFLLKKKQKRNVKIMSFNTIRKYKGAILWGSQVVKEAIPPSYYDEIDTYLKSYKKRQLKQEKTEIWKNGALTQFRFRFIQ